MRIIFRKIYAVIFSVILAPMAFGQVERDISLHVVNEHGRAISDADVSISFIGVGDSISNNGKSDKNGNFSASGMSVIGVEMKASATGRYSAQMNNLNGFAIPPGKVSVNLVLPIIVEPIPLMAARINYLNLPAQELWLGYDFEVGDWVTPFGKGKTADLRFRFLNEFQGYRAEGKKLERALEISRVLAKREGKEFSEAEFKISAGKWNGVMEVSFPNEKDGLIEETERFWPHSELKLPHLAPESGYFPTRLYEANTYSPRKENWDVGFYLRTRVKLDPNGEIISANYAKIYGDFRFDPRGMISFTYYFNPTPNDRNLEFDPKHNLIPADRPGANVQDP